MKQRICYYVEESKELIEGNDEVKTYGVSCGIMEGNDIITEYKIKNISSIKKIVDEICERLKKFEVSPVHMRDVVEDYLEERYSMLKC